jgi:hypothetical protein
VANYNVDIELAVKGLNKTKALKRDIQEITKAVNDYNKALKTGKIGNPFDVTGARKAQATIITGQQRINKLQQEYNRLITPVRRPGGFAIAANELPQQKELLDLVRRRQQVIERIKKQRLDMVGVQASLQRLETRSVVAIADAKREQEQLNKEKKKALKLEKAAGIEAEAKTKTNSKRRSAALTAGAFPLLFGGGPFQAISGAIGGGLTGKEFGGATIGLQVLGGSLDTLANDAVALSAALDGAGDASAALEVFIGRVDSATKSRITNLQQSGQTARAADAAFKELSDTIGETSARGIVQAGKDFEFLKNKLIQVSAIISGFLLNLGQETLGLVSPDPTATGQKETKEFKRLRTDTQSALVIAELETLEAQAVLDKDIERTAEIRKRLAVQVSSLEIAAVARQFEDQAIDDGIRQNKLKTIQEKLSRELLNIDQQRLTAIKQRTNKEDADAERKRREAERERREAERAAAEAKRKQDEIRRGIDSQLKKSESLNVAALNLEKDKLATEYDGIDLLVEQFQIEKQLSAARKEALNAAYERGVVDAKSAEEQRLMLENKNTEVKLETELLELKKKNLETTIAQAEAANRARDLSAASGFDALALAGQDRGAFLSPGSLYEAPETMFPIEKAIEYDDSLQKILDKYPQIQQTADIAANSMVTGLNSIVEGTKTAEEVFADFLRSVADMLFDAAKQMIATYIAIGVAKMFAGMGSGSSGADILSTSSLGSDGGGIFSGGFSVPSTFPVSPRALGGSVSSGRPYLVGERGPELFVPGAQGNIVPNNAVGGVNVGTINISVENTGDQLNPKAQKQIAGQVQSIVLSTLANERRSGGML